MTNDTLQAHIRAYRAGTISISDQYRLVEELVTRSEAVFETRAEARKRFDEMRDRFLEMLFGDDD